MNSAKRCRITVGTLGPDEEELFELAQHDRQYRDYKSGVAKKRFEEELQRAKDAELSNKGFSLEEVKKFKRAQSRTDHRYGERSSGMGDRCEIAFNGSRSRTYVPR